MMKKLEKILLWICVLGAVYVAGHVWFDLVIPFLK